MRSLLRRSDAGTAAIELVAVAPMLVLTVVGVLQLAAVVWTAGAANEALRQGLRAEAAAPGSATGAIEASLPAGVEVVSVSGGAGPGGMDLTVEVPGFPLMPSLVVTRTAVLP